MSDYTHEYMSLEELEEFVKPRSQVLSYQAVEKDTNYEIGLNINMGICFETVGSKKVCMGRTVIPKQTANNRHIHANCEAAMYIVQGTMVAYVGPDATQVICPAGSFVYAAEGEIHGVTNPSDTEDVVLIFSYAGVPNKEAARTIFVKDTPDVYPPKGWDDPNLCVK